MPTRNRRRFVSQAIGYFLRQDYPNKELVVVDDGEDAVANLIPPDSRIRYTRLDKAQPLGTKRNLACELSAGELIAHWDDDDWMSTDRLTVQVAELLTEGADACGLRKVLHYRPDAGDAWLYCYPENERPWLAGGTLLYRRSAWAERRFPDLTVGEDTAFLSRIAPERLRSVTETRIYVALIHPGNTAAKNLADPRWRPQPLHEISRLLNVDRAFYVTFRNGRVEWPTEAAASGLDTVTVCAQFDVASGYGSMAEYLVLGLARAGAQVHVAPITLDRSGMTAEFHGILSRSSPHRDAPTLYFSWPRAELARHAGARELFINTMWESARLPSGWAEQLNRARAVIVPTRFVARACRESGVTVPIDVIPEGVDPDVYHYEARPERESLTTLIVAPVDDRKHVREGVAAWKLAFEGNADARLIIKAAYNYRNFVPDDARIRYVDVVERTRGIARWYREADILLALGNEGFGLPLVEGMATGLPAIALNSEGQADVCAEAGERVLPVEPADWQPYQTAMFGDGGLRGVPGVPDVAVRLKWVATHRDEARDIGRAASEWVLQHRNIWAKAPRVLEVLERHGSPPRQLRRPRAMWIATWGTPCGIAEYTAHLSAAAPWLRVTREPPTVGSLGLLHIQHQPAIYKEPDLARAIRNAGDAGVPVVVTEHTVTTSAYPWEREVDALVATTERAAAVLRGRLPGARVEHIPLGCPASFPPRKRNRGRVIGAFGFHYSHKGFFKLLDVLRVVSETDLLLISHPRAAELEARWEAAAAGLRVRRVKEFLPAEEVLARLAAEADVLVFWYDEVACMSASAAVRLGLATGVPVLTSATGWFRDVQSATYQPANLVEGVRRLLDDTPLRDHLTAAAREYCFEHRWSRIAERHLALWQSLERSA